MLSFDGTTWCQCADEATNPHVIWGPSAEGVFHIELTHLPLDNVVTNRTATGNRFRRNRTPLASTDYPVD